jgi:hypothetical protein
MSPSIILRGIDFDYKLCKNDAEAKCELESQDLTENLNPFQEHDYDDVADEAVKDVSTEKSGNIIPFVLTFGTTGFYYNYFYYTTIFQYFYYYNFYLLPILLLLLLLLLLLELHSFYKLGSHVTIWYHF